jgi:K+-transporting ATPase KdpF subunit
MGDLWALAGTGGFFALRSLFAKGCARIVGDVTPGPGRHPESAMSGDDIVGLLADLGLLAYLVAALLFPERF